MVSTGRLVWCFSCRKIEIYMLVQYNDLQLSQNDLRPAYVSDKNADFDGFVALIKTIITFSNI